MRRDKLKHKSMILTHEYHTRMIKTFKNSKGKYVGIEFNSAPKSKETRNKILGRENSGMR